MPTYEPAPKPISTLADSILAEYETHKPVANAAVKIDFVFARADLDPESGEKMNDAISKNGFRVLGQCRKVPLKERAMGRGDAEITIDGDWWDSADEEDQEALLDHELHHIEVRTDERGVKIDDLGRPQLRMRKHDREYGWFDIIAKRHGKHSQESQQAEAFMDSVGQFYLQGIVATEEQEAHAKNSVSRFGGIAKDLAK